MIAEIIPEIYDATGRQISQPFHGPKGLRPTFPMGRYVSQPLTVHCNTIEDLRQFLRSCRGVSDKKLFDKEDYWQPPDEFEKRKAGDCEDLRHRSCMGNIFSRRQVLPSRAPIPFRWATNSPSFYAAIRPEVFGSVERRDD
jgi:hypothetical protein